MSLLESEVPLWLTSLHLLGFREVAKVVTLNKSTFDHSNPVAFQQVFHFLLSQLVPDRAKAEFRDCWPILDKKQEAEFRRKVVLLVKEVQGTIITAPLPQVNPALFMSPGGPKFKTFLSNLASQVVRLKLGTEKVILGLPQSNCRGPSRQHTSDRFQASKARELRAAVEGQDFIRRLETEASAGLVEIEEEYFSLKKELEQVDKECSSERLQSWKVESREEQEAVLCRYDARCKEMMQIREQLLTKSTALCNHFEEIMEVVDEAKPRLSLDLSFLPRALLLPSSLSSTYQGLCNQLVISLQRALTLPHPRLPAAVASEAANAAEHQSQVLAGLREEWRTVIGELEESLKQKLVESESVDWVKSGLAPDQQDERVTLLPPTPSLLPALSSSNTGVSLTPSLRLSAPDLMVRLAPENNHSSTEATDVKPQVPSTPEAQSQLTRRFPRKITPDQSPLLRQSLIHSTLQRAGKEVVENAEQEENIAAKREASRNHSKDYQEDEGVARKREDGDFSKDSLGVFSPVLSSTLAPQFSNLSASSSHLSPNYVRNLRLPSEELEVAAQVLEEDDTAAKILRYRKILGSQAPTPAQPTIISSPTPAAHPRSISPTSVSLSPSRASLAQEWRSSLASLAGGSAGSSPLKLIMNTTPTPGAATEWSVETSKGSQRRLESEDMDSILVSRLDMLMHNSMTLSDTSTIELDLSLGALCLDPGLLSPHSK